MHMKVHRSTSNQSANMHINNVAMYFLPITPELVDYTLGWIYVMQLRSGEDPELRNTLKNASCRGGRAAN